MTIVDDGSVDSTGSIAKELVRQYGGAVRLVTHEKNLGYGGAVLSGIKNARYDYVFFTDGDLRRTLEKKLDFASTPVSSVMSRKPRCMAPDALAVDAVQLMEQYGISQLLVVDADNKVVGALNMHDLLKAKVI